MAFSSQRTIERTHLFPRLPILSCHFFPLRCGRATLVWKGVSAIEWKKCQRWYSQCRSDRSIIDPSKDLRCTSTRGSQTFVAKEPMVVETKKDLPIRHRCRLWRIGNEIIQSG
ncbi:hypothetical protein TNCV_4564951 [Trichonephila clavipes]|nr:hypothetical protein TNCV_4564951 [Trichonephila clavipes]